ncbi:hypothetical protein BDW22DRAFT_677627 [Trametopsis cervina]|nr:hypothetical protein BDW22DRAFT_677627 [Trametopsis cervina]
MAKYYRIVNFDKKQYHNTFRFIDSFFALDLCLSHFVIPVCDDEENLSYMHRQWPRLTHRSKSPNSKLLSLPDELLCEVFRSMGVEDYYSAVLLCLADGRLLDIGFYEVQRLKKLTYADYAGDRIAFIGTPTLQDFLPYGVQALFEEQKAEFRRGKDNKDDKDEMDDECFFDMAQRTGMYKRAISDGEYSWKTETSYGEHDRKFRQLLNKLHHDEEAACSSLSSPGYWSPHPWVLCNISQGVYVRVDALAALGNTQHYNTPFLPGRIRLDQALLVQICWSSDMVHYKGHELDNGSGAGDRFEVTTVDRMRKDIEWEDISSMIVGILQEIYQVEFGPSWRRELRVKDSYFD